MWVNSLLEKVASIFFFLGFHNLLIPLVSVCSAAGSLDCCTLPNFLFSSAASPVLQYVGHCQCSNLGKTERLVLQAGHPKSLNIEYVHQIIFFSERIHFWFFSHLFHTELEEGTIACYCMLLQTTTFVLSGPHPSDISSQHEIQAG